MTDGQYSFSISLDDKELKLGAAAAKKAFAELVEAARKAGVEIDESFENPFDNLDTAGAERAFTEFVKKAQEAGVKVEEVFEKVFESIPQQMPQNPFTAITPPANLSQQTMAAAQSFNGLNMATQQLVRELPAATMGLNMFFLAVSNNLPIFVDQIKAASEANKELQAQGKPTVGVFKQFITSLFSWQTALMAGITVLTLYGKEIGNWIVSLFKGKEAVDAMVEAQRTLHETRVQGRINAQEEVANLMLTVNAMQDSNMALEERKLAMQRLQSEYPTYFSNMSEEILLYGDLSGTIQELVTNMYNMSKARAAIDKLVENRGRREFLMGIEGYDEWEKANEEFEKVGRKYQIEQQVGGRAQDKVTKDTTEGLRYDRAQKKFLDNLKKSGEEGEAVLKEIKDKFNGDVNAFFDSMDATNQLLEKDAQLLVSSANDAERKRQQDEAKRKQEEAARQARMVANAKKTEQDSLKRVQEQLAEDAEDARTDMTIAAMAEGLEKEKAAINANYDEKAQLINEREAELKKMQKGVLSEQQAADFQALRDRNEQLRKEEIKAAEENAQKKVGPSLAEKEKKAMNEYLIEYGTYQEKRLAITEKYAALISEAQTQGDKLRLNAELKDELKKLDLSMVEKSDLWVRLFSDASKKTKAQIKSIIADTKTLIDYLSGASKIKPTGFTDEQLEELKSQPETIRAIYDELIEKQEELDARTQYPFDNLIKGVKALKDAYDEAKKAAEATTQEDKEAAQARYTAYKGDAEKRLTQGAIEAADAIAFLADNFEKLAEASGDERLKEAAGQISALSQNLSAAGQGAASGGWIGAIVGGVTDIITQSVEAITSAKAELAELRQNTQDFINEYQLLMLSISEEDYESVFGVRTIERAQEAYRKAQEALRAYTEAVNEQMNKPQEEKEANSWGALAFTGFAWAGQRTSELSKSLQEAYQKGYNALQGMQIKTLDRSGWANFWGAKDEYTSLKDLAPQLWDENGVFNIDAAKAFLETNTQLTAEQRKQIEQVIELNEQYGDLMDAVDKEIASIFGDLAGDITDIIFDSVRKGSDAWDEFNKRGSQVIDTLGRKMIQELYVQAYLDQFKEDLQNAYASDDPAGEIARITKEMFDGMGDMVADAAYAAEQWDANAKANGWNVEERTGVSKGVTQASQDSVDELNGRMTTIQSHTSMLVDGQKQLINDSAQALTYLAGIESNTAHLEQMRYDMGAMHNDMSAMRKDISDMATRGIVTR